MIQKAFVEINCFCKPLTAVTTGASLSYPAVAEVWNAREALTGLDKGFQVPSCCLGDKLSLHQLRWRYIQKSLENLTTAVRSYMARADPRSCQINSLAPGPSQLSQLPRIPGVNLPVSRNKKKVSKSNVYFTIKYCILHGNWFRV